MLFPRAPRRAGVAGRALFAALAAAVLMALPAAGRADTGPVPSENALAGTPGWYLPTAPEPAEAGQYAGQVTSIDGWAWPLSSAPGDTVDLHVGVVSGVRYRIEVYRLGWYAGAGARLMTCLPGCGSDKAGVVQPLPPAPDPSTGEVRSGWSTTDTLAIPAGWPSGFYMAALRITSGTGAGTVRRVPFVVRAPAGQTSKIVVVVPVNTWAAYNGWGGKSLYDNHSVDGVRANQVSFERPWMEGVEISNWRYSEYPLIRFLERHDLDVSYVTDADVSLTPGILSGHRVVMTSGHGEYWTHEQRDALDAARDAGQSLAFMGANTGYWQVRYANGAKSMIGYKSAADPIADPALKTNHFRDVGRPECELLGIQYNNTGWSLGTSANLSVVDASLSDPWLSGTGFAAGATMTDTMGYEWDQVTPGCNTPPLTRLFHWETSGWPSADSVRYTAPSGAKVFAAGSLQFSWGLDGWRYNSAPVAPDARLEGFMMRALTDMGGAGDSTPPPAAVTVTPSTATVPTGGTQQFSAALQNATGAVEWTVAPADGGTISASGLYTAPASAPAGTVTVRATHPGSGATDAATVTVVAPAAPQVTTQPASQSGAAGGNATFTAASSGVPAPDVRWQVSTDGGATYSDVAGATSPTLALSGLTIAQSGNRYRAVFTNPTGSATTDAAVLTVTVVTTAPQVTTQPASQSVAAGGAVNFSAAASGVPAPGVQWQLSSDGGATWTDIADATSPTLALTGVTAAQSGSRFRAVFANSAGTATSAAAALTVTGAGGAPVNDAFANALVLAASSGTATASNAGATKETGEPAQAGNAGGRSVWWSWTPSANGSVTIDTAGSSFDTTLGVYTGTSVSALTARAANDDVSGLQTSRVTLNVTAGTTYRISVDGWNAAAGAIVLHWTLTPAGAAPANDAFAAAQTLTGQTGTVTGSTLGATKETGEPSHAGNAGGASVWFSWTPTASGSATIDTAGSTFDTLLAVYTGTGVSALTARASNDDVASGNTTSAVTLTVTAGTTYWIAADGYNAASGALTLHWAGSTATSAPQVTTQPAAQSVTAGGAATFTAAASGNPAPTVQWQVSTDAGATFANVAGATSTTLTLSGVTTAQNGNRYRAVFTNSAGSATSSAATLTVTASGAPANDAFANAQALSGASGTATGTNVGASKETGEPAQGGNAGGKSVWYAWTPAASGSVTIDTAGSTFDTTLGVYTGTTVAALTALGSNDDAGGGLTTSRVTINVVAGTPYRISVDGWSGASGAITLHWALTAAGTPPANDAFANAQVISGNTGTATGTNVNATKESGEPSQAGNAGGASVWYSWTPATSGTATIDTAGSSFDTTLGVYTGTSVGALTLRASNDDAGGGLLTSSVTLSVTAGTTYRISVDGWSARQGTITLHWTH